MQKQKELTSKQKFLNSLANFFQKYRMLIAILLAALLIGVIAVGVISEIKKNKIEKSVSELQPVEDAYNDWVYLDTGEKTAEKDGIIEKLEAVIRGNKGTFSAEKAIFLIAEVSYNLEDYETAISGYEKLVNENPDSLIAPNALFNIAGCYEDLGNPEKALEYYKKIAEDFPVDTPLAPHALYNTGRIYDTLGKNDDALEAFNTLLDEYPDSNWTNSARTSIIQLTE